MARFVLCLLSGLSSLAAVALLLLLLFALLVSRDQSIAALAVANDGTWITYTTADGLPSNTVYGGVAIDGEGQVWAGFEYGDYDFPLPLNPLISQLVDDTWVNYELPGCRVWPLVAINSVYASTSCGGPHSNASGGLSWFIDNTWVTFMPEDGMAGDYVNAIAPEGETKVWLANGYNDVCFYLINLLDHQGTITKSDDEWTHYELDFCSIRSIAVDPAGNRWFGFDSEGVSMLSADSSAWITYTTDVISGASEIVFDNTGNTWFAYGQKVARFDGKNWAYYSSREEAIEANFEAVMTSLNRNRVNPYSLPGLWAIEPPAGVWIIKRTSGGSPAGVAFYNGSEWSVYTHENSGLASNEVQGIAVDRQGNIWMGTRPGFNVVGGLNKFIPWPNFVVTVGSESFFVEQATTAIVHISNTLLRGWVPTTTFSLEGLPAASTASFNPNPATPNSDIQLTLITTSGTPLGTYPLTLVATGAGITGTKTITMIVAAEVYQDYLSPILNLPAP